MGQPQAPAPQRDDRRPVQMGQPQASAPQRDIAPTAPVGDFAGVSFMQPR
jgi:hypothetical protein